MNQKTASYHSSLAKYTFALMTLGLILTPKFMSAQTAGTLDPTFGTGGRVTTFFGGDGLNGDDGYSVKVQTDGKLVLAGITTNLDDTTDFGVVRYNNNGTLDSCPPQKLRPVSCGTVFPPIFVMKPSQNVPRSDLTIGWQRVPRHLGSWQGSVNRFLRNPRT
jgi:beta-propeller uncharacterized protein DUF5122